MHSYLKAVGFKTIKKKQEIMVLLNEVIEQPSEKKVLTNRFGEQVAEFRKDFAKDLGILVHGYYTDDDKFVIEHYLPYIKGDCEWMEEEITITKHLNRESFASSCEDARTGATLIYHLYNGMEFIESCNQKMVRPTFQSSLRLAALSTQGKILFPINKNEDQKEKSKQAFVNRKNLISLAKNGDISAMESLTIDDYDTYNMISQRIQREDIFTIVDTSFMPFGVECDQYAILGEILEMKSYINSYTGELIYNLTLECNDIKLNVGINRDDLLGEPSVGMRFKGSIWLTGTVKFDT